MDPFAPVRLGTSDVTVTRLGLGTVPLGGYPAALPPEVAVKTIRTAWEAGIRYVDTAPLYGHGASESRIGEALRATPRSSYAIGTKVGRLLLPGHSEQSLFQGVPDVVPVFDFSADAVHSSLRASLDRLGLKRVDIVLVHDPDDAERQAVEETYPALAELRDRGAVGAIGYGMNHAEPLARLIQQTDVDCVLLAGRYTLLEQGALDTLLPLAAERGVSVVAGGVYQSGVLADPRPGANHDYQAASAEVLDRVQRLSDVCTRHRVPLRAAAIQFPLGHPSVVSVVVGARTPDEVQDNIAIMSTPIPQELWADLKREDLLRADAPEPN